jgi:hypothetical protein
MSYNPHLGAFSNSSESRWGKPEENNSKIVRYMMCDAFDGAVYGVRLNTGEVNSVVASKKQRKTTLMANWLLNFARQLEDKWICIDTLESGMPPGRYADVLISILATKIMIMQYFGKDRKEWPSSREIVTHPELGPQLRLNPEFFLYSTRTQLQHNAIEAAKKATSTLPISIFGPAKEQGQTRDLDASLKRWELLAKGEYPGSEGKRHVIFCVDNIQQYRQFAGNSYYGLEIITNEFSSFIVTNPGTVGFAVSQPSMTSQRGDGELEARGGSRLAEECNYVFSTEYDKDKHPLFMIIKTLFSRPTPPPTIRQEIEPFSGAFLRLATPVYAEE